MKSCDCYTQNNYSSINEEQNKGNVRNSTANKVLKQSQKFKNNSENVGHLESGNSGVNHPNRNCLIHL
jgi:hypothetical protein